MANDPRLVGSLWTPDVSLSFSSPPTTFFLLYLWKSVMTVCVSCYSMYSQEDFHLLRHVARHGTKHWSLLQACDVLPHRDQKACCNRFILLKRKFFQSRSKAAANPGNSNTGSGKIQVRLFGFELVDGLQLVNPLDSADFSSFPSQDCEILNPLPPSLCCFHRLAISPAASTLRQSPFTRRPSGQSSRSLLLPPANPRCRRPLCSWPRPRLSLLPP